MTTLTTLTPRQVLVVADAALDVAESVGVVVEYVLIFPEGPRVGVIAADGDARTLATELGLTGHRVKAHTARPTLSIEAFEGDWGGVTLTVQHCIPTAVAS